MADQLAQLDPAQLSKTPTVSLPPGTTINFDEPNPLETTIVTVSSVFMGLAFLFVAIRAYTKIKEYSRRSWDDVTCAIGLLGFLSDWLSNVAYIFVKNTFFILYWNIFKPFRWLKLGIIGGAVILVCVYTAFTIASLVGAIPPAGYTWLEGWEASRDNIGGRLSVPLAAWALVSDVCILVLPISGVLRLQLSRKKNLGLSMCFMAGVGVIICSSLSLYYRTLLRDDDVTYTVVNIQILLIVEQCVGICITYMPATSMFLRHVLPHASRLLSKVTSYSRKLRKTFPSGHSHGSNGDDSDLKKTDHIDEPYRNAGNRELANSGKESYDLELFSTQAVKTNVVAGPFKDYDDDRIHLRVDLEQV